MSEQAVYWYVDKDGKYYSSNEVKLFMDADTKTLYLEPPQWFLDKHNLIPLSANPPVTKTREEVARFVEKQMGSNYICSRNKNYAHHYGLQELRELMDFIYGEEPQNEEQKIKTV
jgi:hypothetical protein